MRNLTVFAALALGLATAPDAAESQSVAQYKTRLAIAKQRADAERAVVNRMRDSVHQLQARLDTLTVNHVTFFVDPRLTKTVRGAANDAIELLGPAYRNSLHRLEGLKLRVTGRDDKSFPIAIAFAEKSFDGQVADEKTLSTQLRTFFHHRIWSTAPAALQHTVGRGPRPFDSAATRQWAESRVRMVSEGRDFGANSVGRACYDGDLEACKDVVQLVDRGGLRELSWSDWADSAARQRVVSVWLRRFGSTGDPRILASNRERAARCIAGLTFICRDMAYSLVDRAPWQLPLEGLVAHAVVLGGDGSVERLLEGDGTVEERLARASRRSVNDLMADWRQKIVAAGAQQEVITPGFGLFSVGWVLLFGALSTRSTRWRSR